LATAIFTRQIDARPADAGDGPVFSLWPGYAAGGISPSFPKLTIEEINMKMFYYLQNQTEYHDE